MTSKAEIARQAEGYFAVDVESSATLAVKQKMNALKNKGVNTISLGAGELKFQMPEHMREAFKFLPEKDNMPSLPYTDAHGIYALRAAISLKQEQDYGIEYNPDTEIIVTHGGKGALDNLYNALYGGKETNASYDGGNQVILPVPYWLSHPIMLVSYGGEAKPVECPAEQNYKITKDQLREAVSPLTKLLVITNPNNPTGMLYSEDELRDLAEIIRENPHLIVASEDMYEHYRYDGNPITHLLNVAPDLKDQVICINCFSKSDEMPGGRIGYATGPADIIKRMKAKNSHHLSNAAAIEQWLSVSAITGFEPFKTAFEKSSNPGVIKNLMKSGTTLDGFNAASELRQNKVPILKSRRDSVLKGLKNTRLNVPTPQGSFYIFPTVPEEMIGLRFPKDLPLAPGLKEEDLSDLGLVSMAGKSLTTAGDFVNAAVVHKGVGLVPGKDFAAENGFRISYAETNEVMDEATERLVDLENSLE